MGVVSLVVVYIIFFFYWRYNPLWVLVFSVIFFHSALSLHNFLHPLIPIICIASSMSSIHLSLGLPLFLLPIGFHSSILLGNLFPSIRITWPSQPILLLFTNLAISAFLLGISAYIQTGLSYRCAAPPGQWLDSHYSLPGHVLYTVRPRWPYYPRLGLHDPG